MDQHNEGSTPLQDENKDKNNPSPPNSPGSPKRISILPVSYTNNIEKNKSVSATPTVSSTVPSYSEKLKFRHDSRHSESSTQQTQGKRDSLTLKHFDHPVQKVGNSYIITDHELPIERIKKVDKTEDVNNMIEDLYLEAINKSLEAKRKASLYKLFYIFATWVVVSIGVTVSILSLGFDGTGVSTAIAILALLSSGITTILREFDIAKRGVLFKDISKKLRKIARQLKLLKQSEQKSKHKLIKLEEYYDEVDELDMSMFDNEVTNINKEVPTLKRDESVSEHDDLKSSARKTKSGKRGDGGLRDRFRRKKSVDKGPSVTLKDTDVVIGIE
jgi:hypothetical protein